MGWEARKGKRSCLRGGLGLRLHQVLSVTIAGVAHKRVKRPLRTVVGPCASRCAAAVHTDSSAFLEIQALKELRALIQTLKANRWQI